MAYQRTQQQADFVFGEPMQPCPQCGGWQFRYSMPIIMESPLQLTDDARKILSKWALASRKGGGLLEGPVKLWCPECGHAGPAVDCTGRTSVAVGRDPVVAAEVKRLWNEQPRPVKVEEATPERLEAASV